ncbi:MAG TPA: hypothetical protein DCF95_13025 [Gammaproteobacteria bacterium]|nr:hypothetical protein [Gammaproteobacteria bacterium]HAD72035.1 hypothetical protein [Gammaproteobacteria bacterium]|tara:strand:+ start:823 stop:1350 length:528 start_codon:yes stop_codon:yes gene_type:complete
MNTVLKRMGIGLGLSGLAMGLFYTYMRLHDGPVEFVPWFTISVGGPFRSGELLASPDDWTFLKDREEIEMETLNLGTSKTIWISVVDGRMFIASGRRNTWIGQIWKQWPQRVAENDRIILRVDDKLYEQRLQPITQGPDVITAMTESARKYGRGGVPQSDSIAREYVWLFEVVSR